MRAAVLSGYRRLFRARKALFEGDVYAMRESRVAIRSEFLKNAHVGEGAHLQGLVSMIEEAEDMLRHGFARGNLNQDTGRYGMYVKKQMMICEMNSIMYLILMIVSLHSHRGGD